MGRAVSTPPGRSLYRSKRAGLGPYNRRKG